jgi:hypothetical protein
MCFGHNAIAQSQQTTQNTRSITPQQFEKWVQMTAENFMIQINKTISVTDAQKQAIRKDLNSIENPSSRLDLDAMSGLTIAKEAFQMISRNLSQSQLNQLTFFNPIKS